MSDGIKQIYNEGRVVGLSTYELFVRRLIEIDPNVTVPSEVEWLSSIINNGSGMILKISSGTSAGIHDYNLPAGSALCGCSTIYASVFIGDCTWDGTSASSDASGYWATYVKSYGGLIENNSTSYPTASNIPSNPDTYHDTNKDDSLIVNYTNIIDGILLNQGLWVNTDQDIPYKDLSDPNLSTSCIRLNLSKPLTSDVLILFTGFLNSTFPKYISGLNGSTNPETNDWENGGFLGPAIFPWASKIIFITPTIAEQAINKYNALVPSNAPDQTVVQDYIIDSRHTSNATSLIDFDAIDITEYYETNSQYRDSEIPVDIKSVYTCKDSINAIVAWAPGMTAEKLENAAEAPEGSGRNYFYPPALYGIKTSVTGNNVLVPLDTAAPGNIKMFNTESEAYNYAKQVPNTHAFSYNSNTGELKLFSSDSTSDVAPINSFITYNADPRATITAGGKSVQVIALTNSNEELRPTDGSYGTIDIDTIRWNDLLSSLAENKRLDILGNSLMSLKQDYPSHIRCEDYIALGGLNTNVKLTPHMDEGSSVVNLKASGDVINGDNIRLSECVRRGYRVAMLPTGSTSVAFSHPTFTENGVYDVITSVPGVPHTLNINNTGSSIVVDVRFRSPHEGMIVGVRCYDPIQYTSGV